MVIGKTNLKSVQEAQDEIRLNAGTMSWGAGSFAKGKKIMQPDVVNDVITVSTSVAASSSGVDPSSYLQQIAQLEAQIDSLNAQIDSLEAEAVVDEAEIASLQAQVASLTAQLAAYSNINLNKMYRLAVVENFNIIEENFYVPPVFDSQVISFDGGITKAPVRTINNYAMSTGGYP